MLPFPESFPADAPRTSRGRYQLWLGRHVTGDIVLTAVLSSVRFVSTVLIPFVLGIAIDSGLQNGLTPVLWAYAGAIVAPAFW